MYMKKILTSLILLCFATIGLATNNYFYGIDYTQAKLFASTDKPKQIKISLIRINELLISEKENYDISKFVKANEVSSIRISVRNLDGSASECSFWLYDVRGHSNVYSSSQLRDLIIKEREKVRNPDEERKEDQLIANIAIAVAVIVAAGVLGMGLFAVLRRDDKFSDTSAE